MPNYTPPPPSLDHLNPIQRYMQKGTLERSDWIRLGVLILIYFTLRPYISLAFKKFFSHGDLAEGEKIQEEYKAKVGPNAIRGAKQQDPAAGPTVEEAVTSGSNVKQDGTATNRKAKVTFDLDEPKPEEKLLDEDWETEPARKPIEGDKNDVVAWLDKWDQ